MKPPSDPIFFESPGELRKWLLANHDRETELWIGFHKKATGRPTLSYQQALDEMLAFGWIDGIRKGIDDSSYTMRYTPRRRGSNWSEVNTRRVGELLADGRMHPAGIAAFEARDPEKTKLYSYEERTRPLEPEDEARFRANAAAWERFQALPASYRRAAQWWVRSAKREETRARRLATLIETSARGERIRELTSPGRREAG